MMLSCGLCSLVEIDGKEFYAISPSCEQHAPKQPYISRASVAMKAPIPDRKRHTSHAPSERE